MRKVRSGVEIETCMVDDLCHSIIPAREFYFQIIDEGGEKLVEEIENPTKLERFIARLLPKKIFRFS